MKIDLAKNSGFCMGVRHAVLRIVNEINSADDIIYVYGPLIHNPQTIDILSQRGLQTINDLSSISSGSVAIRTHGIPIEEYRTIRQKANRVINLTCPRVARVQAIIKKYSRQGYFTLITGDDDHAEVVGLKSYAQSGVFVISRKEDLKDIPVANKYLLVSQTTLDRTFFNDISSELKNKIKDIEIIDTICDSTRYRQEDVLSGIKEGIDTLVVVGGKNSSNTKRLAQIGQDSGIKTYHIETAEEIDKKDYNSTSNVLVTAGASTPGWIINNVLEKLYWIKYSKSNIFIKYIKNVLEFLVRTNVLSSLAAFFLSLVIQSYSGIKLDYNMAIVSLLYIFSMYSINNYLDRDFLEKSNPYKFKIYGRFGKLLLILSVISICYSLWISTNYNVQFIAILTVSYLLGIIYSAKSIKRIIKKFPSFIQYIYNSKVITSFGWLVPLCILPAVSNMDTGVIIPLAIIGSLVFFIIFLRHILMDIIALQGDLIFGRESLPVLIGTRGMCKMSIALTVLIVPLFILYTIMTGEYSYLLYISIVFYLTVVYIKLISLRYIIALKYELLVDTNYLLIMLISIFQIYR